MEIRFVLGPAGSGKTHRCLEEIRAELRRDPEGGPLLMLAPKQSTFQLERQLLGGGGVSGWTRLQILSFDRLARMVLEEAGRVELLDEEGRVMVLRALLRWHQPRLRVFRASARMAGFARELSGTLRELTRHRVTPGRLEEVADEVAGERRSLADKLRDLADLGRAYGDWLAAHRLWDGDQLAEVAAARVREAAGSLRFEGVWLDGFAEMTPQEVELLAAVARVSRSMTLAFCVDDEVREDPPWLSTWAVVGQTVRRVHTRLAGLEGVRVVAEVLGRREGVGRFAGAPALAHLEAVWTQPREASGLAGEDGSRRLRLVACSDFEREAEVAAREVWRHVRGGGRFREVAVLVRALEERDAVLRRVFLRYGIPFFIDRRESLAHHPMAELTRCGLRLAAYAPRHEDWFGAMKTGLAGPGLEVVDAWENDALAAGMGAEAWLGAGEGGGDEGEREGEGEGGAGGGGVAGWGRVAARHAGPFRQLRQALAGEPDGFEVAAALRAFWGGLGVREVLEEWAAADARHGGQLELQARVHGAVWEQMEIWLDGLERGFEGTRMAASEWVAIVDAGLVSLTAGVIPPSQDQVMIGAVDRSRQPELGLALVLGMNDGVFPAVARGGGILGEHDRERLAMLGVGLDADRRRRVGHERYLGYVALTRSAGRVVVTWSERDASGRLRLPSPFVASLRVMFPGVPVESGGDEGVVAGMTEAEVAGRVEHGSELLPWLLARGGGTGMEGLWGGVGGGVGVRERVRRFREGMEGGVLSGAVVAGLYGVEPEVAVSALEGLAACPFRFFVSRGLRGRERTTFEVDRRHTGSLAHELLARFHGEAVAGGRRWRDWTPEEARRLMGEVAARHLAGYGGGVFMASAASRWEAAGVVERLEVLVGVLVGWMGAYRMDPVMAEVEFGGDGRNRAWRVEVGDGRVLRIRGKVDRVDVMWDGEGGGWYVVVDYKLRPRLMDERLLGAGIDLQLAAYALALADVLDWSEVGVGSRPELAGMFYVGLMGDGGRARSRSEGRGGKGAEASPHRHRGRLRVDAGAVLDSGAAGGASGQFAFKLRKDGTPSKQGDGREPGDFGALLAGVRERVRMLGGQLLAGDVAVSPYRLGARTACDGCEWRAVCRFDGWTQAFRRLDQEVEGGSGKRRRSSRPASSQSPERAKR